MFPADCLVQVLVLLLPLNLCSVLDLLLVVKAELNNRVAACCWAQLSLTTWADGCAAPLWETVSCSFKSKLAHGWRLVEVFLLLAFCFLLVFPRKERSVGPKHESVRSSMKNSKIIDDRHHRSPNLSISIKPKETWVFSFFYFTNVDFQLLRVHLLAHLSRLCLIVSRLQHIGVNVIILLYREAGLKP